VVYVVDDLFFMEKALTHLSGYIDSQNSRTCSAENPHAPHEKSSAFFKDRF
jgi:hypothetical protein